MQNPVAQFGFGHGVEAVLTSTAYGDAPVSTDISERMMSIPDSSRCNDVSSPLSPSTAPYTSSTQALVSAGISQGSVENLGMRHEEEPSIQLLGDAVHSPTGLTVYASNRPGMQRQRHPKENPFQFEGTMQAPNFPPILFV